MKISSRAGNLLAVAVAAGAIVFSINHDVQSRVDKLMANAAQPCSASQQATLVEMDSLIHDRRDQIKRWYGLLCDHSLKDHSNCERGFEDKVLDSYGPGSNDVDRYCAAEDMKDRVGVGGIDISKWHEGGPAISLYPFAFQRAQYDPCVLIDIDVHERVHALTGLVHDHDLEQTFDSPYVFGLAASAVCEDVLAGGDGNPENDVEAFNSAMGAIKQKVRGRSAER